MAREEETRKLESELVDAAIEGRWDDLGHVREELVSQLIGATRKADRDALARIEARLLEAHRIVVIRHKVSRNDFQALHAWGLLAEAHAASMALREIPKQINLNHREISVSELVLKEIFGAPGRSMTNAEFGEKSGVPPETISRVMKRLRADRLITSRRAGRYAINELTERGLEKARALIGGRLDQIEPVKDAAAAVNVIDISSSALRTRLENRIKGRSKGGGYETNPADVIAALRKE